MTSPEQEIIMRSQRRRNDRGVALLIVLLVTALLIALIFEFSYATRISLNNAINFRDSQRAYFLARSGIFAFIKYGKPLRELIPQGEWGIVPMISDADTEVRVKWEDESGKIKINDIRKDTASADPRSNPGPTLILVRSLFETVKGIDTAVIDRIADPQIDISNLALLSGLHQYMSDEEYNRVYESLTVAFVSQGKVTINVNTASADVLRSFGLNDLDVKRIITERQTTPYTDTDLTSTGRLSPIIGNIQIKGQNLSTFLTTRSTEFYRLFAYATVGGYTKQIEAIVNGNTFSYWRSL
jgi:type II secretory pathway component PulK